MSANSAGKAAALTILTPIHPDRLSELSSYLRGLPDGESPLKLLPATHFARWVIVGDFQQGTHQLKPDQLKCRYLLFTGNVDSPADKYVDDLVDLMGEAAAKIWSCCIGCPDPAAGSELKAYLRHNQLDTGFFYSAYPQSTVKDVKESLDVRRRLVQLILATQGLQGAALQDAFVQEFAR